MIEKILPGKVVGIDVFGDVIPDLMFKEEADQIRNAVPKRKYEYMSVRHCARQALAQTGFAPTPLPRGKGGVPLWPKGSVGSMTHCSGYRAAAVAHKSDFTSVGIDAERNEQLPNDMLSFIASIHERALLEKLNMLQLPIQWDMLLFCAKEAVFKTWYPVMEQWLGFEDVCISFQIVESSSALRLAGTFSTCPVFGIEKNHGAATSLINAMIGQWQCTKNMITTSVTIRRHE